MSDYKDMFVRIKETLLVLMCIFQQSTGYSKTVCLNDTGYLSCQSGSIQIDQVLFPFIDAPCDPVVPNYCRNQSQQIQIRCNGKKHCMFTSTELIDVHNCPVLPRKIVTDYMCGGFSRFTRNVCGNVDNLTCISGKITNLKFGILFEEENQCEASIHDIKTCVKKGFHEACSNKNKCDSSKIQREWCFNKPFSISIDYRCVLNYETGFDQSWEKMGESEERSNDDEETYLQTTTKRYNTTPFNTDKTGIAVIAAIATLLVLLVVVSLCMVCIKKNKENQIAKRQGTSSDENNLYHTVDTSEITDSGVFNSEVTEVNDQSEHDYFVLEPEVKGQQRSMELTHDYFVLDPVETGFLRSNDHYSKITDSNLEIGPKNKKDKSSELINTYSATEVGDYDLTNNRRHVSKHDDELYDHTVENTYDHTAHGRHSRVVDNPNYDKMVRK